MHIDPEDDNVNPSSVGLPMRQELVPRLNRCFSKIDSARKIKDFTLHYLEGEIKLEILLPVGLADMENQGNELLEAYKQAIRLDQTGLAEIITSVSLRFD